MRMAVRTMKPTPRPSAAEPASLTPSRSPAPKARPTRTVAACPTPIGAMKATDAIWMAIW